MTRFTVLSLAALALGIAAGVGCLIGGAFRTDRPQPIEPTPLHAPVGVEQERGVNSSEVLRQEVVSLRAELLAFRQEAAAKSAAPEPTRAKGVNKDVLTDPHARAEAEADRQMQMAAIESAFQNESNHPQWASATTNVIRQALDGVGIAQSSLRNIECRSHTCRVEIADEGSKDLPKSLPLLALQVGQTLPSITAQRIDGQVGGAATVLYLSAKP